MKNIDSVKDFLLKLGLTMNEALVYKSLLNEGRQSIRDIATNTGVSRTNLYHILGDLKAKEIVQEDIVNKKIAYQLKDPAMLISLLEGQKSLVNQASALAEIALPEIKSQFSLTSVKPSIRYYEGVEGIKSVYREIHSSGIKEYFLLRSIYDTANEETREVIESVIMAQKRLGIDVYIIAPYDKENSQRRYEITDQERGITRRIVEHEKLQLPAEIIIWGDAVSIVSFKEGVVATTIYNKDIASTHKQLFDYIWEKAKPYHDSIVASWKQS